MQIKIEKSALVIRMPAKVYAALQSKLDLFMRLYKETSSKLDYEYKRYCGVERDRTELARQLENALARIEWLIKQNDIEVEAELKLQARLGELQNAVLDFLASNQTEDGPSYDQVVRLSKALCRSATSS